MAKELADQFPQARALLDEVDDALGQKLSALMFEGPQDELTLTANAQPALMAASLAAVRVLEAGSRSRHWSRRELRRRPFAWRVFRSGGGGFVERHRYCKIVARPRQSHAGGGAGRGRGNGGPAWYRRRAGREIARQAADQAGGGAVCAVANDNGGGQIVMSGTVAAVNRAVEIAKDRGARRSILLPVSAPFHCCLMRPAAEVMAAALAKVEIKPPVAPVVTNVLADQVTDPADIRLLLIAQTTATVRWRESIIFMAGKGVTAFIECGAGKVLAGLVKRISASASAISIGAPEDIGQYRTLG